MIMYPENYGRQAEHIPKAKNARILTRLALLVSRMAHHVTLTANPNYGKIQTSKKSGRCRMTDEKAKDDGSKEQISLGDLQFLEPAS